MGPTTTLTSRTAVVSAIYIKTANKMATRSWFGTKLFVHAVVSQSNAWKVRHGTSKSAAVNALSMNAMMARSLTKKAANAFVNQLSAQQEKNSISHIWILIADATALIKNAHATFILTQSIAIVNAHLKHVIQTSTLIQKIVHAAVKSPLMSCAHRDISGAQIHAHASVMDPKFVRLKTNTLTQKFVDAFANQKNAYLVKFGMKRFAPAFAVHLSVLIISFGTMLNANANVLQYNVKITSIGTKKCANANVN